MKEWVLHLISVILILVMVGTCTRPREVVRYLETVDTLYIRDTIYQPVPVPEKVYISHVDTVWFETPSDTVFIPVPIERKEYRTDDYFAVVEGWRPELVRIDLFPQTQIITNTVTNTITKKPRFGIGVQAGYGYNGDKISPYIGVGLQYNLFTF